MTFNVRQLFFFNEIISISKFITDPLRILQGIKLIIILTMNKNSESIGSDGLTKHSGQTADPYNSYNSEKLRESITLRSGVGSGHIICRN